MPIPTPIPMIMGTMITDVMIMGIIITTMTIPAITIITDMPMVRTEPWISGPARRGSMWPARARPA